MAFPNISDIATTTIEERSGDIADNVTKNNALLMRLKAKGKIRPVTGGRLIYEEVSFAENGNAGWYSGYDVLSVGAQDVLTSAEFSLKQFAVGVPMSGLEMLQNAGEEQIIDLLEGRMEVAESTMANYICQGMYSDGTTFGGKTITGLDAAVPQDPTTGTYGGINRATWTFWRSQLYDPPATPTAATIQGYMNTLWASTVRGADRPDLILSGSTIWATYMASLQAIQRFTSPSEGNLGFPSVKFMDADVVLDGGIGGFATATDMYFLNTKYISFRPHKDRNMRAINPSARAAFNQDAQVTFLGWAGNVTSRGPRNCGRLKGD